MNSLDSIKVPDNIDVFIDKGINKAEEKLNKQKRKTKKKIVSSVAAGIIGVVIIGAFNPVVASKIPVLKSAFEAIQNKINHKADYSSYATTIDKTVSSGNLDITLSEVVCDGKSLNVSFKLKSKTPFKYRTYTSVSPEESEDGKERKTYTTEKIQMFYEADTKISFLDDEPYAPGLVGFEGSLIDDYTFVGVEYYDLNYEHNIPDNFEYEINIKEIKNMAFVPELGPDEIFKGDWNFKVPVKVDRSANRYMIINDVKKEFRLNTIDITPFQMKVTGEYLGKPTKNPIYYTIRDENKEHFRGAGEYGVYMVNGKVPKKLYIEVYEGILNEKNRIGDTRLIYKEKIKVK